MRMLFGPVGDTKRRSPSFQCDEARDNEVARQAEKTRNGPSSNGNDSDVHGRCRILELRDVMGA